MQNAEQLQESLARTLHILKDTLKDEILDVLEDCIESADAIMQCALAQKHVAEDLLSYGAIGASSYSISAIEMPLLKHFRTTIKMFSTECKAKKIHLKFTVEPSIRHMATVNSDPTRLMQILINLLANAVRFTQHAKDTRQIAVTLAACTKSLNMQDRLCMPSKTDDDAVIEAGQAFHLYCSVVSSIYFLTPVIRSEALL